MEYQNLSDAKPIIQRLFSKNPRRSISATFRKLRNFKSFSFFGDYPLLATITHTVIDMGIKPSRQQVLYTLNQSEELKEFPRNLKIELLEQLLRPSSVALSVELSKLSNSQEQTKNKKMNNLSSKMKRGTAHG